MAAVRVPGDERNLQITRPADLDLVAMILGGGKTSAGGTDPLGPKRKFSQWKDMDDA